MLHIVNKSPYERTALESCLRLAQTGSPILLTEDGVYAAVRDSAGANRLQDFAGEHPLYVLEADAAARGIADRLMEGVEMVDYDGFVDLVADNDTCQSWL